MDMVLYALIKKEIENTPKDKVSSVGGYEISFVNSIPENRGANTIYFVMGEGQEGDRIYIGQQGITNIIVGDHMIDYGILDGNVFLDRYDFLRGLTRVIFSSLGNGIDGYLECSVTVDGEKVDSLVVSGGVKGESTVKSVDYYGKSMTTSEERHIITDVNKIMFGLPDGTGDSFDVLTGEFTQIAITDVIDSRITWLNVGLYGDYREFRINGYSGFIKPIYMTYSGTFNSDEIELFTVDNAYANNGFEVIGSSDDRANKACIYVSSALIKVRVLNSELDTANTSTLAKAMQKYIAEHPINIVMKLKNPVIEQIAEPKELLTFNEVTQIEVDYEGDNPVITAKLPIKED